MNNLYFNNYQSAFIYAWDSKKEFKEESAQSDEGQTMVINIYDENYQIIERLFFDESLYENVPYKDRY